MKRKLYRVISVGCLVTLALSAFPVPVVAAEVSAATRGCIGCHEVVTPGIVGDWRDSRHAAVTPAAALARPAEQRRISTAELPDALAQTVVGCAECHAMNADRHPDSFEHNGYTIHAVVSPPDCAVCHPVEADEYADNLMSRAHTNLVANPLYARLVANVNGGHVVDGTELHLQPSDAVTNADSCLACHGTEVKVTGTETRTTTMGEMTFPTLSQWPNNGVGRVNPDGSVGACSSCHMRHRFSIAVARQPYTCAQCHKGPDVPAYKVYAVSVHGNIQKSADRDWDYTAVPWVVGKDFTAPTCATCHLSEVRDDSGTLLVERSHRMNDRLPWRIFGLPYAHPHPLEADTTNIVNRAGLHLPTELTGEPVDKFLIDAAERDEREAKMRSVCRACHSEQWVRGHFERLDRSIAATNHLTLQATKVLSQAWEKGLARGVPQGENPFDEAIEIQWVEQWLFYANSTRFASAMGGADYGVFANGRWQLQKNLQEMRDRLKLLEAAAR